MRGTKVSTISDEKLAEPKKPIRANRAIIENGRICMFDENEFWKCPNNHGVYDIPLKKNQKFCHECGQAIDWENE